MLRQNIHRCFRDGDAVKIALTNGAHERGAFEQVVTRRDEEPAFGNRSAPVASAADALQGRSDGAWRTNLADQIHAADIDSQFERSRGDERADLCRFQFSFRSQPQIARQTAVMCGDGIFPQAFPKMVRHALRHTARIDKNQRGAMLGGQPSEAIVDFVPHFVGGHGAKLAAGDFHGQIEFTPMADLHDVRRRLLRAGEKIGHEFDGFLRRGETDARQPLARQMVEAFERQRQVRAALVVRDRVDFVHDDRFDGPQDFAASCSSQQNVQGFRRSDQNVRRMPQHGAAFVRERVSGAHGRANFRHQHTALAGEFEDFAEWNFQVFLNVVAQRLERRHVENFRAVKQSSDKRFAHQAINTDQKGCQRLARTGRCRNQRGFAGEDMRPTLELRLSGRAKTADKPVADKRMRPFQVSGVRLGYGRHRR